MKKIYTLALATLFSGSMMAQMVGTMPQPKQVQSFKKPVKTNSKATATFFIDYDDAENMLYSPDYSRLAWDINADTASGASLTNFIVAFDSIVDYQNFQPYVAGVDFNTYSIDSIYFAIGHENNSGTNDTIHLSILPFSGYPNLSATPLWDTVIVTNTGITGGYLNIGSLGFAPNLTLNATQKICAVVEYAGNFTDSLAVLAGYHFQGQCASINFDRAVASDFSPNTYATWASYVQYGTLPTSTGVNIYYDCDNSTTFDPTVDGVSFLQNGGIWIKITTDPLSVNDLKNNTNFVLYPNPVKNQLTIKSNVTGNVEILDITGKVVLNAAIKTLRQNIDVSELPSGVYFVKINNAIKKFVVTK